MARLKWPRASSLLLALGFLFFSVLKFWIIRTESIYYAEAEYDDLYFLRAATHWYWGADYSWTAFARPPAYPLWLALIHSAGIPLRWGIELLQMAGYTALVAAMVRAGLNRAVGFLIYAALTLHPASYQMNNHVTADSFYAGILPLALAGLVWTFLSRRMSVALATGAAFAVLWNTREESLLIAGVLFVFALITLCHNRLRGGTWSASCRRLLRPAVGIAGALGLLLLTVDYINYRTFGAFAKSEMTAPSYLDAYRALRRIKPSHEQRFVPVSREARQLAYGVSPTFALLQPHFEGKLGQDWAYETFTSHGISGEIGAGWFHWAFRNAADHAGMHSSAARAKKFYSRVAREINRACEEGRLPHRLVLSSFGDPTAAFGLPYLPQSFHKITALFVRAYGKIWLREDFNLRQDQRDLYLEMTGRHRPPPVSGRIQLTGWAFQFNDPVISIAWRNSGGEIVASTEHLLPRPDVVEHFFPRLGVPLETHFILPPVELSPATDLLAHTLVFVTRSGSRFAAPVASVLSGFPPRVDGAPDGAPLTLSIDSQQIIASTTDWSVELEKFIGKHHRSFVLWLSLAGSVAAVVIMLRARKSLFAKPLFAVFALLMVVIVSRAALFIFIDATAWPGAQERYLFPVTPLYSAMLILLIYLSFTAVRRLPYISTETSGVSHCVRASSRLFRLRLAGEIE
ncbi:MAG: hypothetical protein QOE34_460 [Verrucomicrobiota bacterium]|jgi:hypothetical protein